MHTSECLGENSYNVFISNVTLKMRFVILFLLYFTCYKIKCFAIFFYNDTAEHKLLMPRVSGLCENQFTFDLDIDTAIKIKSRS